MERAVFGIILEQREEEQKAGQREKEVNKKRKSTSETPQRLNVATLQLQDVSVISTSTSLKSKGPEIEEDRSENVWTRARIA